LGQEQSHQNVIEYLDMMAPIKTGFSQESQYIRNPSIILSTTDEFPNEIEQQKIESNNKKVLEARLIFNN
jgi:hypothetical protein